MLDAYASRNERAWLLTVVYRAQRNSDRLKSPAPSGTCYEGIEYRFPIADWSDERVREFLASVQVPLPANYATMSTSLDCWNCSAYRHENGGKMEYMKQFHPEKHAIMTQVFQDLESAISAEM